MAYRGNGYLCRVKIGLLGYGKMGKEIETIAVQRGHEIMHRFNSENIPTTDAIGECDSIIEFTRPELVVANLHLCLSAGKNVITGTTGWYTEYDAVCNKFQNEGGTLFTASNFSLGVNILFHLNRILAGIMKQFPDYRVSLNEIHHTRKLDAPSGTAITLAEGIIENNEAFIGWELDAPASSKGKLSITAVREADVPGTHTVLYESEIDSLQLGHIAHNRKGFALGAVLAAEWCLGKKGVFGMQDMLNFDGLRK